MSHTFSEAYRLYFPADFRAVLFFEIVIISSPRNVCMAGSDMTSSDRANREKARENRIFHILGHVTSSSFIFWKIVTTPVRSFSILYPMHFTACRSDVGGPIYGRVVMSAWRRFFADFGYFQIDLHPPNIGLVLRGRNHRTQNFKLTKMVYDIRM